MTSLRDIRRRLRSVENIKKITDAMERVAAARLRRAQTRAQQIVPYVTKMQGILESLSATEYSHPLFKERPVKKSALIIISADKGLSGAYNTNIINAADKFLKKYDSQAIDLILFGKKAVEHYKGAARRTKNHVEKTIVDWGGKISFNEVKEVSSELVSKFLSEQYDEIWLLYTRYINVMENATTLERFLHIGKPQAKENKTLNTNYIFEPSPKAIYTEILPRYLATKLQAALDQAYASELASRIIAMQTASRNSESMITDLTLMRNKIRQEGITREIIEISVAV